MYTSLCPTLQDRNGVLVIIQLLIRQPSYQSTTDKRLALSIVDKKQDLELDRWVSTKILWVSTKILKFHQRGFHFSRWWSSCVRCCIPDKSRRVHRFDLSQSMGFLFEFPRISWWSNGDYSRFFGCVVYEVYVPVYEVFVFFLWTVANRVLSDFLTVGP